MSEMIEVRGLFKSYGNAERRVEVLKGVDLVVRRRTLVAVMGPSGVGKSTLLHVLGALDPPDAGEVLHEGVNVFRSDPRSLDRFRNRHIGFVFQFHYLLPEFTALENVAMPCLIGGMPRKESLSRAAALLDAVGVGHRGLHRPGELSGGEQQRVSVARALAAGPRVLLADEPTGNLDAAAGGRVFELFRSLHEQRDLTTVVVTHNERLAATCDAVFHMRDGRLLTA